MTSDTFNPVRSFRAAYALFIATPLLMFAEVTVLNWLARPVAPLSPPLALASYVSQVLLGQVLILVGAGLPTWHWFRQLRQSHRKWSGITITVIALAHYALMQWWCTIGCSALTEYLRSAT